MSFPSFLASTICALLLAVSAAFAPVRQGLGNVRTGGDQPVAGAGVDIDGIDLGTTTGKGAFSFDIPPFKVGFPYTFHLSGWIILDPCVLARGRLYLPDPDAEKVSLRVARPGDVRILTVDSIGCMVEEKASHFESRQNSGAGPHAVLLSAQQPIFVGATTLPTYLWASGSAGIGKSVDATYVTSPALPVLPSRQQAQTVRVDTLSSQASTLGFTVEQLQSAIERWRTAIGSAAVVAPYQKGLAAFDAGRYGEAKDYLSQSVRSGAAPVERYVALGRVEYELGNYDAAESALRRVLEVHKDDPLVLHDLQMVQQARNAQAAPIHAPAPLPEGAVFAFAEVEPDSTIEVEQPGYAVIATASVLRKKRVNPGDHLPARSIISMLFDTGMGMLIHISQQPLPPLRATVGTVPLLTTDRPQPLPVNSGNVTMYVGSDQPFATTAIATDTVTKLPAQTYAVILNGNAERVGQLSDYSGLSSQASNLRVITQGADGSILREGAIAGGVLDGSPSAVFDKPNYHPGQWGLLVLGNQQNYQKMVDMTRFGGGAKLTEERIQLIPLSDVKGLPAEAPFGTAQLKFQAVHPGQARVAVYFPRAVSPKRVANAGGNPALQQANAAFEEWLSQ